MSDPIPAEAAPTAFAEAYAAGTLPPLPPAAAAFAEVQTIYSEAYAGLLDAAIAAFIEDERQAPTIASILAYQPGILHAETHALLKAGRTATALRGVLESLADDPAYAGMWVLHSPTMSGPMRRDVRLQAGSQTPLGAEAAVRLGDAMARVGLVAAEGDTDTALANIAAQSVVVVRDRRRARRIPRAT